MTCRKSLGPLSSPEAGRQDLRRTQLGRPREKGGSKVLSRTQSATPWPLIYLLAFVLYIAFLWVPLEPGNGGSPR